jgi:hypothetical protein
VSAEERAVARVGLPNLEEDIAGERDPRQAGRDGVVHEHLVLERLGDVGPLRDADDHELIEKSAGDVTNDGYERDEEERADSIAADAEKALVEPVLVDCRRRQPSAQAA